MKVYGGVDTLGHSRLKALRREKCDGVLKPLRYPKGHMNTDDTMLYTHNSKHWNTAHHTEYARKNISTNLHTNNK
jgi:hypothetical protein